MERSIWKPQARTQSSIQSSVRRLLPSLSHVACRMWMWTWSESQASSGWPSESARSHRSLKLAYVWTKLAYVTADLTHARQISSANHAARARRLEGQTVAQGRGRDEVLLQLSESEQEIKATKSQVAHICKPAKH